MKKKLLIGVVALVCSMSAAVCAKVLISNQIGPVNTPVESLTQSETHLPYQSLGYCTAWHMTFMCVNSGVDACQYDCDF